MLCTNWEVSSVLSSIRGTLRHWNHWPASRSRYPVGCLTSAMKCAGRLLMPSLLSRDKVYSPAQERFLRPHHRLLWNPSHTAPRISGLREHWHTHAEPPGVHTRTLRSVAQARCPLDRREPRGHDWSCECA